MADFYQSSLFNPSAPSEGFLKMMRAVNCITRGGGEVPNKTGGVQTESRKNCIFRGRLSRVRVYTEQSLSFGHKTKQRSSVAGGGGSKSQKEINPTSRSVTSILSGKKHKHEDENCCRSTSVNSSKKIPRPNHIKMQPTKAAQNIGSNTVNCPRKIPWRSEVYLRVFKSKPSSPRPPQPTENENDIHVKSKTKHRKFRHILRNVLNTRWPGREKREDMQTLVEEEEVEEVRDEAECGLNYLEVEKRINHLIKDSRREEGQSPLPNQIQQPRKRRRLKTKCVSRAGARVRRSVMQGCHYVGEGLVNMTTYIPEAAYVGPIRYTERDFVYPSAER